MSTIKSFFFKILLRIFLLDGRVNVDIKKILFRQENVSDSGGDFKCSPARKKKLKVTKTSFEFLVLTVLLIFKYY